MRGMRRRGSNNDLMEPIRIRYFARLISLNIVLLFGDIGAIMPSLNALGACIFRFAPAQDLRQPMSHAVFQRQSAPPSSVSSSWYHYNKRTTATLPAGLFVLEFAGTSATGQRLRTGFAGKRARRHDHALPTENEAHKC